MRFGGHQTFAIRDGWLYKGLRLAVEDRARYQDPDLAEWLGVGRNMAKAIVHWMLATGLAERDPAGGKRTRILRPTEFGELVWRRDRYFLLPGTWWAVHVRLVNNPAHAYSWNWFFNRYSPGRFEKPTCVEALRRHLTALGGRVPVQATLERDVSCLLRSYAVTVPARVADPEDSLDCPLSELGFLVHSRQTGFHRLNRGLKPVPHAIFAYAVASARESGFEAAGRPAKSLDYSLTQLAHEPNAPGRVFALTSEALFDLVSRYESEGLVDLSGSAGERVVRMDRLDALGCLDLYYEIATDMAQVA